MTLKRRIFDTYIDIVAYFTVKLKAHKDSLSDLDRHRNVPLCFVTIAFNNVFLIEQQIRLIKKYITDRQYIHIIADNSNDCQNRITIRNLCIKEGVEYISLPYNWFQKVNRRPSYAHGLSMIWIYRNIILKIKPEIFGFLDHDIFPIADYSVEKRLGKQDFFGRLVDRTPQRQLKKLWYLWAGFCFFRFDKIKNIKMNFFPCKIDGVYLDTAGSVYRSLYASYNLSELQLDAPLRATYFREGNDYHSDLLHFIDNDWVHTINGSNWTKGRSKDNFLKDFLKQY